MNKLVFTLVMTAILSACAVSDKNHKHYEGMDMSNLDHSEMDMGHGHGAAEMMSGEPGNANDVTKVIKIEATDMMRFKYEPFSVKARETVKFIVTNSGNMKHEFVIGTIDENEDHRTDMMEMMKSGKTMMHADANAVSLAPGEMKTLIWKFNDRVDIEADCNIPGHYEGGMHMPINVTIRTE